MVCLPVFPFLRILAALFGVLFLITAGHGIGVKQDSVAIVAAIVVALLFLALAFFA